MIGKLVRKRPNKKRTLIRVGDIVIGGDDLTVIAGPCAIESLEQYLQVAVELKKLGVRILRGGVFKPRTSPYDFQGLGYEGLEILLEAKKVTGMVTVTEVMDSKDVEIVARHADIIQIGSRSMHNYVLLKEVGKVNKPVLLKRGLAATIKEWLLAAEYIMLKGNNQVILCERGIRSFETLTRNTLDINSIPIIKCLSHLPVIVDPSHASGKRKLIGPLSKGAIATGADGVMIEVHPCPPRALSDKTQSLSIRVFEKVLADLMPIAKAVGRRLYPTD